MSQPNESKLLYCPCCEKTVTARKGFNCDALVCEEFHCTQCGNTLTPEEK